MQNLARLTLLRPRPFSTIDSRQTRVMGNTESFLAEALSLACQGTDDAAGGQPQFLAALEEFLIRLEEVWSKLPDCVTNAIKSRFLPYFASPTDPEAWVLHQIFSEAAGDTPTKLYGKLNALFTSTASSKMTRFDFTKRNVWLVAFARIRKLCESNRENALVDYITREQHYDRARRNCSNWALAGERLESVLGRVGGSGALICGLRLSFTTLSRKDRFEKVDIETDYKPASCENIRRCNKIVDTLLVLYGWRALSLVDLQGCERSRKRKRESSDERPRPPPGMTMPTCRIENKQDADSSDSPLAVDSLSNHPVNCHYDAQSRGPGPSHDGPRHFFAAQLTDASYSTSAVASTEPITPPARETYGEGVADNQKPSPEQASNAALSMGSQIWYKGLPTVPSQTLAQASTNQEEHSSVDLPLVLLQRPISSKKGSTIKPSTRTSLVNPRCATVFPFAGNEFVFQLSRNDVPGLFSDPHSPSPPQALLVSENLFHIIKVYFENSCRDMNFDDYENLLAPNGARLDNAICNDFDSYCFTATMLVGKESPLEFRHALSKAFALVRPILEAEHPRTLACFFEVSIHLIQTGLPEVASHLCSYIKEMSANVIRRGHPWREICQRLGELDSESLEQAMAKVWECTTDIFDSELGAYNRLAVSARLDYIKRVVTDHLEEERLLQDLLTQLGGVPRLSTPRVMLNLAHNFSKQGRHDEAETTARRVLLLLGSHRMYASRNAERIESLKIVSRSQCNQGKAMEAEQTMQEAIQMVVDQWGVQHPWVPEFKTVLQGWLREWGRKEDADKLRWEIEELIGEDEIEA
ncbi:hypothetical protein LX32DRAFT_223030 [Colletotrichum zoysiae]|uniref:Uncharacterized protein n=1 Tax=Colletotrichum zoysiae TaxID=1216348 RepID=A0AAD9H4X6_9PEZI|nr:hypothetical protein LX32DRAFT_223030 [Colletotrichum zoysiae]